MITRTTILLTAAFAFATFTGTALADDRDRDRDGETKVPTRDRLQDCKFSKGFSSEIPAGLILAADQNRVKNQNRTRDRVSKPTV